MPEYDFGKTIHSDYCDDCGLHRTCHVYSENNRGMTKGVAETWNNSELMIRIGGGCLFGGSPKRYWTMPSIGCPIEPGDPVYVDD